MKIQQENMLSYRHTMCVCISSFTSVRLHVFLTCPAVISCNRDIWVKLCPHDVWRMRIFSWVPYNTCLNSSQTTYFLSSPLKALHSAVYSPLPTSSSRALKQSVGWETRQETDLAFLPNPVLIIRQRMNCRTDSPTDSYRSQQHTQTQTLLEKKTIRVICMKTWPTIF